MPVNFLPNEHRERYGVYAGSPSALDLARYFHLDDTDHAIIAKKRGGHNRLGYAVQLSIVRYLGTFLEDPFDVPPAVLQTLAKQLHVEHDVAPRAYRFGERRWDHAAEIRDLYGYVDYTQREIGFRLTRWLYGLCWTDTDRPNVLFERAAGLLITHKVLLLGRTTLERDIARLRAKVETRLSRSNFQQSTVDKLQSRAHCSSQVSLPAQSHAQR